MVLDEPVSVTQNDPREESCFWSLGSREHFFGAWLCSCRRGEGDLASLSWCSLCWAEWSWSLVPSQAQLGLRGQTSIMYWPWSQSWPQPGLRHPSLSLSTFVPGKLYLAVSPQASTFCP